MSVLILIDQSGGHFKKASFEALTYGADIAKQLGVAAEGLLLGTVTDDIAALVKYGITKVHQVNNENLNTMAAQVYAN